MNVKKLMDSMKHRDELKHEREELKQELEQKLQENAKNLQHQLIKESKNNALLNTIQSAFEETESNAKLGNKEQNESVRSSAKLATAAENAQLRKALAEQSQTIRDQNVIITQNQRTLATQSEQLMMKTQVITNLSEQLIS